MPFANPFAPVIVAGPAHGVLTQNAYGSYTYTPDANYNGADIIEGAKLEI